MNSNIKTIVFIIYLAALAAFAPFSIDAYLASLPILQTALHTTSAHVQLSLSLFFVAYAIAQLCWGPLSDRLGRKAVLYLGITIFITGSLLCALSHGILSLLLARMLQAIGACSGIVITLSIVKDTFKDKAQITKVLSAIVSIMIVAPMIAPIIGSYLLFHFNWQSIFYFLAAYGLLLLLGAGWIKESHHVNCRAKLSFKQLLHAYREQITYKPFLLSAIAVSSNFSVMFAFVAASSFIYIKIYHLAPHLFGYYFAINASALIIATYALTHLKKAYSEKTIITLGLGLILFGSTLMLCAVYFYPETIWSIIAPAFIVTFGVGMLFPLLTAIGLDNVVAHTGLSSALLGTTRFSLAALISLIIGLIIHHSAWPLGGTMLCLSLVTAACMLLYRRSATIKHNIPQCAAIDAK